MRDRKEREIHHNIRKRGDISDVYEMRKVWKTA